MGLEGSVRTHPLLVSADPHGDTLSHAVTGPHEVHVAAAEAEVFSIPSIL